MGGMISTMGIEVLNRISRRALSVSKCQTVRYSTRSEVDTEIPTNQLRKYYSANDQTRNGVIYDNKPFKYTCEAGKTYSWCLCGHSHSQPFCDGTHRNIYMKIKQKPILFKVKETKDYWLCNCKQTSNRPFCDGSHMSLEVKAKTTYK